MNVKEAKKIICNKYKTKKIIECLEFDDFFAFGLADKDFDLENDSIGGAYITVNKSDGKIGVYNPFYDALKTCVRKKVNLTNL